MAGLRRMGRGHAPRDVGMIRLTLRRLGWREGRSRREPARVKPHAGELAQPIWARAAGEADMAFQIQVSTSRGCEPTVIR
jgi:hypothetical protein